MDKDVEDAIASVTDQLDSLGARISDLTEVVGQIAGAINFQIADSPDVVDVPDPVVQTEEGNLISVDQPSATPGLVYSAVDAKWKDWSIFGLKLNETYGGLGSPNGCKNRHHENAVVVLPSGGRRLLAIDTNKVDKAFHPDFSGNHTNTPYVTGAMSTREKNLCWGLNQHPDKTVIRFEFDVVISDYGHAFWPACWLRAMPGGAGVHEPDVLELFTAQDGCDKVRQTVHTHGHINFVHGTAPITAGVRHTVWFEAHRDKTLKMGIDSHETWTKVDPYYEPDKHGWDAIIQSGQIGGEWAGNPDLPYGGRLQNGNRGVPVGIGPSHCPTWDGDSWLDVLDFRVLVH